MWFRSPVARRRERARSDRRRRRGVYIIMRRPFIRPLCSYRLGRSLSLSFYLRWLNSIYDLGPTSGRSPVVCVCVYVRVCVCVYVRA